MMGDRCRRIVMPLLLFVLLAGLPGCSLLSFGGGRGGHKAQEKKDVTAPQFIEIQMRISEWTVSDHRILGYDSEWGTISFAGRYLYRDSLVMKLKASSYPEYFWLANIPEVESGSYKIRAVRYQEHYTEPTPLEPPARLAINVVIRNRRVASHAIDNPHPGWGAFVVDSFRDGILYLRNAFYPESVWATEMPRSNGEFVIYAALIEPES